MESDVCRYCYRKIKSRDELVTAFRWMEVKPYHYVCYQELQKETTIFWKAWKPLNGWEGNTAALLLMVVAVLFLFTRIGEETGKLVGVIALYPLLLRGMSYFLFERKIK